MNEYDKDTIRAKFIDCLECYTLTGAASICGVTPSTIMHWRDGMESIPSDALAALEDAIADNDIDIEPVPIEERIKALRSIKTMLKEELRILEYEIDTTRRKLAATISNLNDLLRR